MVLSNPAMLKVIALQCDLFSMGYVCVKDKEGKEIENDPFLTLLKNPNPFQGSSQFLWDFMFWNMLGNDYCYVDSKIVDRTGNKMYFLDPSKMEWPADAQQNADKLLFSDQTLKDMAKKSITYRYSDGSSIQVLMDRLITVADLTNGVGNWAKGPSRIDSLYKVISNSEHSLDAKNINIRYTGKFLVSSENSTDMGKLGLGKEEAKDIREKIDSLDERVWPVKTKVQIRRFVDDLGNEQFDKAYLGDYFIIGSMYGIPRDVLEAYASSTYENQEKARAAHINYCLDPKGNQFMNAFEKHFGYDKEGKNIEITWNHLPFMHVFEKERAEVAKVKVETLNSLLKLGVSIEEANEFLGTEFEIDVQLQQSGQG